MQINDNIYENIKSAIGTLTKAPIILCIGSDRITGDSLGPLVGHMLKNIFDVSAYIYGTLNSPVTALNLVDTIMFIKSHHVLCPIIAIDSSLGKKTDIGAIQVFADGIYPGAAVGKALPKVGDYSITATVAEIGKQGLYSVRLGFVYQMAHSIALSLAKYLKNIQPQKHSNLILA